MSEKNKIAVFLGIILWFPQVSATPKTPPLSSETIGVKIGYMNRLSELKSRIADQKNIQDAAYYAIGLSESQISSCGYHFEFLREDYSDVDKLAPIEASRALEQKGAWIIYGPSNSYEYQIAKRGIQNTPMVSAMAGAKVITNLDPPFFTMYPTVDKLAHAAVVGVKRSHFGRRYGEIVDASCNVCRDFADEFETNAKNDLVKIFSVEVVGTTPDLSQLFTELKSKRIDFLLVPNYLHLSGYIIEQVQRQFPLLKYVGADAWGDEQLNDLSNFNVLPSIKGLHVRAGPSSQTMRQFFRAPSLFRQFEEKLVLPDFNAYMMLQFVRRLAQDICDWQPKEKVAYTAKLTKSTRDHFRLPLGISVFSFLGTKSKLTYVVDPDEKSITR